MAARPNMATMPQPPTYLEEKSRRVWMQILESAVEAGVDPTVTEYPIPNTLAITKQEVASLAMLGDVNVREDGDYQYVQFVPNTTETADKQEEVVAPNDRQAVVRPTEFA